MPFNQSSQQLTITRDGNSRIIHEQVIYLVPNDGRSIEVPQGFKCDFASVPQFLHSFVSNEDPRIVRPAIIHDFLYGQGGTSKDRKRADTIFYQALREEGLPWFKAALMYRTVRLFGSANFNAG